MTDRGLDAVEKGNLRQLCGFAQIGQDTRLGKTYASNWTMMRDVRWLQHGSSDVVYAAIGSYEYEWMKTNIPGLNCLTDDQLKKLMGARRKSGLWKQVGYPAAVFDLADGASLVGLTSSGRSSQGSRFETPSLSHDEAHSSSAPTVGAQVCFVRGAVACFAVEYEQVPCCSRVLLGRAPHALRGPHIVAESHVDRFVCCRYRPCRRHDHSSSRTASAISRARLGVTRCGLAHSNRARRARASVQTGTAG